jgi:hypothetical protein
MTETPPDSRRESQARPRHGRPRKRRSELERLLGLTVLGPTHPELGTCWRFTGTTTPYGRIAKAQDSYTHRLGWKLLRGPIPEGKELHHRCGVYACWNPDHLQLVTHAENLAYKRKTHCKHGHPLSGQNLRINPRTGARGCQTCLRESQRRLRTAASRNRATDLGPARLPGRPGRPAGPLRSDLERLLDDTVLGRPHPELGACWLFTGPTDPYGRIDRGSERFSHRLGWKLLRGPDPRRHGAPPQVWRPCLLESGSPAGSYPCGEHGLRGQDTLQARACAIGCELADRRADGGANLPGVCRGASASLSGAPGCAHFYRVPIMIVMLTTAR